MHGQTFSSHFHNENLLSKGPGFSWSSKEEMDPITELHSTAKSLIAPRAFDVVDLLTAKIFHEIPYYILFFFDMRSQMLEFMPGGWILQFTFSFLDVRPFLDR